MCLPYEGMTNFKNGKIKNEPNYIVITIKNRDSERKYSCFT